MVDKFRPVDVSSLGVPDGLIRLLVIGFILLIVVLVLIPSVLVIVPAGYVGVDYNAWGGVNMDKIRSPGWSFKFPIVQSVYLVKTARDTINLHQGGDDIPISSPTKEGLTIVSDVSVLYRVQSNSAPKIVQELTINYRDGTLIPQIRSVMREVTGVMSVTEIYGPGREKIQKDAFEKLKPILEQDGFILEDVLIRELKMPSEITRAIEDKQAMEQLALKKQYELELTQKEAERKKIEGEGMAQQTIAIANGDAQARVIVAKAEAEALKMIADTMKENPKAYDYKQLQVLEQLYQNQNVNFVALPSNQMIYQLPESISAPA
jgi:regulator of protease activity HflC (stomatin/prohibitin superfamily)